MRIMRSILSLTLTSQTGFNQDFLWSTEDYNRFDTTPGIFAINTSTGRSTRRPDFLPTQAVYISGILALPGVPRGTPLNSMHKWTFLCAVPDIAILNWAARSDLSPRIWMKNMPGN